MNCSFALLQPVRSTALTARPLTLQVITNSFLSIGVDRILAGGKGFINCPQALLDDERLGVLPQAITVLEVLETVRPDAVVIAACRRLKDQGYTLALDYFIDRPGYEARIELADIIKVDFRELTEDRRRAVCEKYGKRGIRMLAEKVETREEFQQALEMGYDYYQGYFFARPLTLRSREIAGYKANYLNLLREIYKREIDRPRVAELIQREASLAYRLLRYINSAAFDRIGRVSSIRRALALLGDDGIRKWTWLAALPNLTVNKPSELMVNASIRARFRELIAPAAGLENRQADLFLMGMLSRLDAMLDRSLDELLPELRLPRDLEQALLRPVPAEPTRRGLCSRPGLRSGRVGAASDMRGRFEGSTGRAAKVLSGVGRLGRAAVSAVDKAAKYSLPPAAVRDSLIPPSSFLAFSSDARE
jgi:EAL and modified HD-GYP domain-containing signal transduction protein